MSISIPSGATDRVIDFMIEALQSYEADHPESQIDLYRHDPFSIRVRIINPEFAGRKRTDRSKEVWEYLNRLPEEAVAYLSSLTLLAPEESSTSGANVEFEESMPSRM